MRPSTGRAMSWPPVAPENPMPLASPRPEEKYWATAAETIGIAIAPEPIPIKPP